MPGKGGEPFHRSGPGPIRSSSSPQPTYVGQVSRLLLPTRRLTNISGFREQQPNFHTKHCRFVTVCEIFEILKTKSNYKLIIKVQTSKYPSDHHLLGIITKLFLSYEHLNSKVSHVGTCTIRLFLLVTISRQASQKQLQIWLIMFIYESLCETERYWTYLKTKVIFIVH